MKRFPLVALTLAVLVPAGLARPQDPSATDPAPESDAQRLDRLERENAELSRRLDVLAGVVEADRLGDVIAARGEGRPGLGPSAAKVYDVEEGLSIGGYGEVLYENRDAASGGDQWDTLRAVLYFGYRFDERWVFNSEIEIEHANEISAEFAYLDYLASESFGVRGGLLLAPMGFLNELHEPTTFLSAKRPVTETVILPSTWRENGLGVHGDVGEFSYRAYVMTGFDASGFDDGGLRGGRQKGSKAAAEDLALSGRLDWKGMPGLTVGASGFVGDSGQDMVAGGDVGTTIYEGHVDVQWRGWQARALYAHANLDDVAALNASQGFTGTDSVGEQLRGWYVELGYDVMALLRPSSEQELIPFVRYEEVDTQAEVPAGFAPDPANDLEILTAGVHWRPRPGIAVKLDYMDFDDAAGGDHEQVNLSLGYSF